MLRFIAIVASVYTSCVFAEPSGIVKEETPSKEERTVGLEEIGPIRYVLGGLLGIVPGFGLGHSVQKRWQKDYGWVFTVAETALLSLTNEINDTCSPDYTYSSSSASIRCREWEDKESKRWERIFWVVKVAEVVSVWWPRNISLNPSQSGSSNLTDIRMDDYVPGGLLGSFVGFGIGHAYQGRWWRDGGMFYTFSQLGGIALLSYGSYCSNHRDKCFANLGFITGTVLLISSRVSEIFSVWELNKSHYRLVSSKPKLPFSVMPLLDGKRMGLQLALLF